MKANTKQGAEKMKTLIDTEWLKRCQADDDYYDDPNGETRQVIKTLLRVLSPAHRAEIINDLAAEGIFCRGASQPKTGS